VKVLEVFPIKQATSDCTSDQLVVINGISLPESNTFCGIPAGIEKTLVLVSARYFFGFFTS